MEIAEFMISRGACNRQDGLNGACRGGNIKLVNSIFPTGPIIGVYFSPVNPIT